MALEVAESPSGVSSGFRSVVDVFLSGEGLPFSQILSAERIERICRKHGCERRLKSAARGARKVQRWVGFRVYV